MIENCSISGLLREDILHFKNTQNISIQHCTFADSHFRNQDLAIIKAINSSVVVEASSFRYNEVAAIIFVQERGTFSIRNCSFVNNINRIFNKTRTFSAFTWGNKEFDVLLWAYNSSLQIVNSSFTNNRKQFFILIHAGSHSISNCSFINNTHLVYLADECFLIISESLFVSQYEHIPFTSRFTLRPPLAKRSSISTNRTSFICSQHWN